MRTFLISAAAAASALAFASPAAAQYYPAPPPAYANPYGSPYGNAYGYNNYGQTRSLHARINNLQRQIAHLDSRDIITEREARRLREQSRDIERQLRYSARNGLHPREAYNLERRVALLEQRIWRDANDGRGNWNRGYGYNDNSVYRDGRRYVRIPVRDRD